MTVRKDTKRGTWYYVVDGPTIGGKRRQIRRRGFPTKHAATAAEAALLVELSRGTYVQPSKRTVGDYLTGEWLPAKRHTVKPSTAASYAGIIDAYIVPHIGTVRLDKVDGGLLNGLYGRLMADGRTGGSGHRGGLSPKTVRNVHGVIHRAFGDAVRWRHLTVNPADQADPPRHAKPQLSVWSSEQLGRFIASTSTDRLAAVWHLFATTGMRRGEVLGLRWADVDMAGKRITIRQTRTMVGDRPETGTPKTAAGVRVIALDDATVAALRRWKGRQGRERLAMGAGWFDTGGLIATEPDGTPIHPQVLTRRFHAASKAAGLPAIRLHDVRHSYATAALGAGVPVKVLAARLGHADIAVTLRTYAHVMPNDDANAAAIVAASLQQLGGM
jgi:integrase